MDELDEPGWSRSEWARWWLDHDEADEAARVLEPGDEVALPGADSRDLAAALVRRGLNALYEDGVLFVNAAGPDARTGSDRGQRRPPQRSSSSSSSLPVVGSAKKTA